MREEYDEYAAAGRLRVPVAAWRWATGSGLVTPADAGTRLWSRAVVEAADPEAVRAALRGPVGAGWAADRLTEALGVPLPILRPRVTASAVGRLVKAGLLVYLGGDVEFPDVHPDQVAALARRRDLPALLDRHVPLGPDQAARRLGVRRVDFDQVVWLGWVAPGTRSPLAALDASPVWERVLLAGVARMAGVTRAAVVNWRRRHGDFPEPVAGTDVRPQFDRPQVVAWLLAHDKIGIPTGPTVAPLVLAGTGGATRRFRLDDPHLVLADDPAWEDVLSGWSTDTDADTVAELVAGEFGASLRWLTAPGTNPLAVMGEVRVIDRFRSGSGGLRLTLAWWNRWRRLASLTLPLRQLLRSCVGRKVRLGWESVMAWSIAEVARMSGVTSRTLRHYCPDLHQPKAQLPHHKDPLQPQQLALS
ncbi:hypothetical protein [Streptomyces sp. A1136]|uniref:hypothetical protein n=1 Tax=Streptomyces sp. A1136 TaxID=2563102 RepID=UPI0019D0DDD0|nr:hypothetical protein [Streptomyces sp. A1136]